MAIALLTKIQYGYIENTDHTIEFRVVARFQSVKQMMNRYKVMYELVNTSINHPRRSFNKFLEQVRPIIMAMYDNDADKVEEKLEFARKFNNYLRHGRVHESIARHV